MMSVEEEFFKKESERIFAESERCHLLNHRASEGSSREDILIKSLSNILPEKYGLCKGVVFNETKKSKQVDIIIYNKVDCYKYPISESQYLVPIESVFCVIEVKSSLTKTELLKAIANIKSVLDLHVISAKQAIAGVKPPFSIIFAYNTYNCSLDSLCKNLNEELKNDERTLVNAVCILKKGLISLRGEHNVEKTFNKVYNFDKYEVTEDENSLHNLFTILKTNLSFR